MIGLAPAWRLFWRLTPLLLIAPALALLIALGVVPGDWIAPLAAGVLAGLAIAVIGMLLAGALRSAAPRGLTLSEMSGALDAAPIVLVDGAGRVLHWSQGCETLYGWTAAEAMGRAKHELLRSRSVSGHPVAGADALADGERELSETRADGSLVHVIETARHIERAGGRAMVALSMTDIGARRSAEAALRDSEERLALASSAHQIGLFEWDVPSGKLTWTTGSEQRLGLEAGAISDYESWAALVEPADLVQVEQTIADAAARRVDRFSFRYRLKKTSGSVRALEGSARCVYDEAGALVRTNGVNLDITAHEEREAALRASEAHLRSILETVPDGMVVIDGKGLIRSFSPAAERLFGYSADEAIGCNVSMLIPGEDGQSHDDFLARYRDTGVRRVIGHRRTMSARRADGAEFPVELHVGEAWIGEERLFTGFVRDISDRVAAEQRMRRVQDELMHAARLNAVGEMAAALAHELNQPLSAVVNFVATAEILVGNDGGGSQAVSMLENAREQALRAGEIIRRLREFIARREADVRIEPVADTIREATALLTAGRHHSDVQLAFDLDPAADRMVADRIQVQQVLVNLLRNAYEALATVPRDRRSVTIGSRRLGEHLIEISVSDSGPGLPIAVPARTFAPFTSTKGNSGMGLGLSICQRIIEAHGGEFLAENRPEGGARFRFTLPAASNEELRR